MKPVIKTTVVDQVIKNLISAIKKNKWEPGEKIPGEIELAEMLKVSRTSIREALRVLSYFKVIISKPGYGTVLSSNALRLIHNTELALLLSDDQEMQELWEIRLFLEPQIAYWAAIRATKEDIKALDKSLDGAENAEQLENKTIEEKLERSALFHRKLAEICRNNLIVKIMDSIQEEIDRQRMEWESQWLPEVLNNSILEHREILRLIRAKDPEGARDLMFNHMLEGFSVFEGSPPHDISVENAHALHVPVTSKKTVV